MTQPSQLSLIAVVVFSIFLAFSVDANIDRGAQNLAAVTQSDFLNLIVVVVASNTFLFLINTHIKRSVY